MALLVQKFGGSSLQGAERFRRAAARIAAAYEQGDDVVAVLSARGDTTDRLLAEARTICPDPPRRETDLLLSVGEQIAVAQMAMQLAAMGLPATALTGWQAGVRTDSRFGDARIHHVTGGRIRRALSGRSIVLTAGFQGISESGDITTLGRGGSDTPAVALAANLGADACRIYTDVDGVYTADPRLLPEARRLEAVSFDDMLELARLGAQVLHSRCVELARAQGYSFEVRSSLAEEAPGTRIVPEAERRFCGVTLRRGVPLPTSGAAGSQVSIVGAACAEQETTVQVLRALDGLELLRLSQQARSISAYLPDGEALEAARRLHYLFLS